MNAVENDAIKGRPAQAHPACMVPILADFSIVGETKSLVWAISLLNSPAKLYKRNAESTVYLKYAS
jgi:hypothetical protein